MIGKNVRDLFPSTIEELEGGLIITEMKVKLLEENRYLGFARTFPFQFEPLYQMYEHPRTLAIQENQGQAEHEESQVFRRLPLSFHRDNPHLPSV